MNMFESTHKLHCIKLINIDGLIFRLCYFWQDDSIFSSNYRRCFVLLPKNIFFKDEYKIDDLVDYYISFALAKVLFNISDN